MKERMKKIVEASGIYIYTHTWCECVECVCVDVSLSLSPEKGLMILPWE
jgi:hypothetical protein